jgi:hypothetical protein
MIVLWSWRRQLISRLVVLNDDDRQTRFEAVNEGKDLWTWPEIQVLYLKSRVDVGRMGFFLWFRSRPCVPQRRRTRNRR